MHAADMELIAPFVSSVKPEDNVYAIFGLPEEVISVLFAYVSRSPKGFRENLAQILKDGDIVLNGTSVQAGTTERARKFHEKWTVAYGHSSVAEHTAVHLGVEKISRIASAELELADPFLSFTEYSQRYQRPKRGDWHIPDDAPSELEKFYDRAYTAYETSLNAIQDYLRSYGPKDLTDQAIEKIAFENARAFLPLGMHTNLGLSGNALALSRAIVKLSQSPLPEIVDLAYKLYDAGKHVAPTLIRHPDENLARGLSPLLVQMELGSLSDEPEPKLTSPNLLGLREPSVKIFWESQLTNLTPAALRKAIELEAGLPYGTLNHKAHGDVAGSWEKLLSSLSPHDQAPRALKGMQIHMEMTMSEACWHQLLRHRGLHVYPCDTNGPMYGYIRPALIREMARTSAQHGYADAELAALSFESRSLYMRFSDRPDLQPYTALNATAKRVQVVAPLWGLFHFTRLRTRPDAQDEIRELAHQIVKQMGAPGHLAPFARPFASKNSEKGV